MNEESERERESGEVPLERVFEDKLLMKNERTPAKR